MYLTNKSTTEVEVDGGNVKTCEYDTLLVYMHRYTSVTSSMREREIYVCILCSDIGMLEPVLHAQKSVSS